MKISKDFLELYWGYGWKHVLICPRSNTCTYYFNYKHTFSLVLITLVDAEFTLMWDAMEGTQMVGYLEIVTGSRLLMMAA